jgi:hypothetical protein
MARHPLYLLLRLAALILVLYVADVNETLVAAVGCLVRVTLGVVLA